TLLWGGQTRLGPGGHRQPAPAEDFERQGDRAEGAEQEERPADGPALLLREAVRQQQADARAQGRAGGGDQGEFRKGDACFSHVTTSLGGETGATPPAAVFGRSRRHSEGFLSGRSPSKRGCRKRPFCVHSAKATSPTRAGLTQCTPSPRGKAWRRAPAFSVVQEVPGGRRGRCAGNPFSLWRSSDHLDGQRPSSWPGEFAPPCGRWH